MEAPDALARACPAGPPRGLAAWLSSQFAHPRGVLGHVAGWIMATRGSNVERGTWSIELLGVEPGHRVLEIGFGPGVALAELARRSERGLVVGIDRSEAMLRQARRRNAQAIAAGRMALHLASVERLPRFAEPFDRILAVNCVQFWHDAPARLAELRGLLRPGSGRIAVTLQPRHPGATDADAAQLGESIRGLVERAGFEDVALALRAFRPVAAACVTGRAPGS